MASRRSRPHRLLLPILLAGALVAEITGLAIARSIVPAPTVSSAFGGTTSPFTSTFGRLRDDIVKVAPTSDRDVADAARDPRTLLAAIAHIRPTPVAGPGTSLPSPVRSSQATVGGDSAGNRSVRSQSSATSYHGRNHVSIPSLGVNRSVSSFPCSRTRPPDNYVYRWGCGGRNNVYLLGHAYSVFKPLHDAYTSGRLRKGMKVVYADGAGRVQTFAVIWWRVVAPTTAASWAWAAQSRPSMTLQTCVGASSAYRLMVRLVQVG